MNRFKIHIQYTVMASWMLITFGIMYYVSTYSYLVMHTFAELTGVGVSITIFSIGWNTREHSRNNYMTIMAVGYLIVGVMSIFHTLTYKGMGVFPGHEIDIPTQFWVATRFIEGFTLLLASLYANKKKAINSYRWLTSYLILCFLTIVSIFTEIFPDCFLEGTGLTNFKIMSEYLICILLIILVYVLWKQRSNFETDIYRLILISIVFTILSELSFTLYKDPYGLSNLLGHFFMLHSVILIYITLIKGNLTRPYKSLYKNVADYAEELAATIKELEIKDKAIASSLNAIVLADVKGIINYVNESFLKLLGYKEEEVLGYSILDFINPSDKVKLATERFRKESCWYGEVLLKKKDETFICSLFTANYIFSKQGEPVCIMVSFLDITEQKNIEEELIKARKDAEAANMAKSYFLANMSHEIRTPMNGILGFLGLLENSQITKKQKDYINSIKNSTDSLLTIVNDILDVSKIEFGKIELENISFHVRSAIESAVSPFIANAKDRGLDLKYIISPEVPKIVNGDPTRLRQVLSNLIGNAIKFTSKGHVLLAVELKEREGSLITLLFTLEDTGIGLSEEAMKRIFEPFAQADVSSNRKFGGTGLGLAICKSYVTMMGGSIQVESVEGKGSRFTFTVSLEEVNNTQESRIDYIEYQSKQPNENDHRIAMGDIGREWHEEENNQNNVNQKNTIKIDKLKVLLVEDNEINIEFFKELLKIKGIDCDVAVDGEEAVRTCLSKHYDLVFMDCQMPIMDGYEATRRIREAEGDNRHTIIIAITANAMKGDIEKCMEYGMDEYLSKPIEFTKITTLIDKYLKTKLDT